MNRFLNVAYDGRGWREMAVLNLLDNDCDVSVLLIFLF